MNDRSTALYVACEHGGAENLLQQLIQSWPAAVGLVSLDHDRPMLPNELVRLRQNTAELAATWTPQMQHLVDRATQRLLWSLVELV